MNLNEKIMNLQTPELLTFRGDDSPLLAYRVGHRDARHAAAELALKADACIEALRELDKRLKECAETPASAADAYDSFYRGMVADALAAAGDA